nr:hypothetical protein [Tanacetum cinerariifolium]
TGAAVVIGVGAAIGGVREVSESPLFLSGTRLWLWCCYSSSISIILFVSRGVPDVFIRQLNR